MVTVGVRDLRNNLSRYLRYVKNGERISVTERDQVIAEICLPEKRDAVKSSEEVLLQMSREGKVILAASNKTPPMPTDTLNLDWKSVLDEVRADRF